MAPRTSAIVKRLQSWLRANSFALVAIRGARGGWRGAGLLLGSSVSLRLTSKSTWRRPYRSLRWQSSSI